MRIDFLNELDYPLAYSKTNAFDKPPFNAATVLMPAAKGCERF
jgi:hypothetical protein